MVNKTTLAIIAMAIMLTTVFFALIGGEVAEDSEAANETFVDDVLHLRYEITSSNTVEVDKALTGCPSELVIPSTVVHSGNTYNVTSINSFVFEDYTLLSKITIPDSVTDIYRNAFYGCTSLTSIKVDSNNTHYDSDEYGVLFNEGKTILIQYPVGNVRTSYEIADSVTEIGDAFEGCTSLKTVIIGSGVTTIDEWAFEGCTTLTEINVKAGNMAYSSEDGILFNYEKTTLIQFPRGSIITSYTTMPDSVTNIIGNAFKGCTALKTITIGIGVTSIGAPSVDYSLFGGCTSLTEINVKAGNMAYSSEDGILFNYEKTTLIRFPIGSEITSYTTIPGSVKTIGNHAFRDCTKLSKIIIPDNVTEIDWGAFISCTSLKTVKIGSGVKTINHHAFGNCTNLLEIIIPDSVETIDYDAFSDCTSLKTATIGIGVTYIGGAMFGGCTSLTAINVKDGNKTYSSEDGILFNYGKTTLIRFPIGSEITSYTTIPGSVKTIGNYAFRDCTKLSKIIIPDNVTEIGGCAFYGCISLSKITLPDGVITIGNGAFRDCTKLSEITIPDNVTTIDYYAFCGCTSIETITIGSGVKTIGGDVFSGCTSLEILKIGECKISDCHFSFDTGLKYICIAEGAEGLDNLLKNYEFYDSDGEKITDWSKIAGQNYKVDEDGKMHYYDGPLPGPESNNPSGPNIGLIVGIIVAVVAILCVGVYYCVFYKKQ